MTSSFDLQAAAISLAKNNLSVVILGENKGRPLHKWEKCKSKILTPDEISGIFSQSDPKHLALVGGKVSGQLYQLDFEGKDHQNPPKPMECIFSEWAKIALLMLVDRGYEDLFDTLVFSKTPGGSGGVHVRWRVDTGETLAHERFAEKPALDEDGNFKRTEKGRLITDLLVESRQEGQYAVCPPSPGYEKIQGSLLEIPTIPYEAHRLLLDAARSFNQVSDDMRQERQTGKGESAEGGETSQGDSSSGKKPGDEYNERGDYHALLTKHGYYISHERSDVEYWGRAASPNPYGATFNAVPNKFYSFSESDPNLEPGQAYSPFALYTYLEHDGDFKAAAKALGALGFGEQGEKAGGGQTSEPGATGAAKVGEWIPYGDVWNADRFFAAEGQDFAWVDDWNFWMVWSGKRWTPDRSRTVEQRMEKFIRGLIPEAQSLESEDAQKAMMSHIKSSLRYRGIQAAVNCLKYKCAKVPEDFDKEGDKFNAQNCTIDLKDGRILPHCREDFMTKISPAIYHGAYYEEMTDDRTWQNFMESVQPDVDMRSYLSHACGYTMTDSVSEHCLFYLYGDGANGKTTFINTIAKVMGDYAAPAPRSLIEQKKFDGDSTKSDFEIADLAGRRMSIGSEVRKGAKMAEALIKDLTGEDERKGRHPYGKRYVHYRPTDKMWWYGNHLLEIQGTDLGIWRRIRLIQFDQTFENPDRRLGEKLSQPEVLSQVLSWMVQGCMSWWSGRSLFEPEGVIHATDEYRASMDEVGLFIDQWCMVDLEDDSLWCPVARLYEVYSENFGGKLRKDAFAKEVGKRGFPDVRRFWNGTRMRGRQGIGIAD